MAAKVYEFNVEMTCDGCSNAVKKVLDKHKDVENVDIDLGQKKVYVTSKLSSDQVLECIKKTGKTTSFVGLKN